MLFNRCGRHSAGQMGRMITGGKFIQTLITTVDAVGVGIKIIIKTVTVIASSIITTISSALHQNQIQFQSHSIQMIILVLFFNKRLI